jgi:hypothetical protein
MHALRLNHTSLWLHIIAALVYSALTFAFDALTTSLVVDGSVGVLLGLYVCSCPAKNTIDVLFADRFAAARIWATRSGRGWLALNGLALLGGWLAIWCGMTRLVGA